MRIARSTLIGTAVAWALFGQNAFAAPGADANPDGPAAPAASGATDNGATDLQEVVVTGIRGSVQESLDAKRKADLVEDVISAEDIGKMPDKNVADSLARVPGLTTSSAGANEGGFDENDRVSMRGTNPSLTLTTINGHNIAAGDWFVLDQAGTVGRSVSFTLLPSEIVSQVAIEKSSSASLLEGGVAGTVDIRTRKPLDLTQPLTLLANAGAVYAQLPSKADGQYNGLAGWKNDAGNIGVLVQLFSETRHLQRNGVEILGYDQIAPGSAIALAHPDLTNVYVPHEIGEAYFVQERQRNGGLFDFEVKPVDNLTLDLSAFHSKLTATNTNRNYLLWPASFMGSGAGQSPDAGYVVENNTLVSATFAPVAGTHYGVYDQISRPDESATANFVNLDADLAATDNFSLSGQVGYSWGDGRTPTQNVSETDPGTGSGASYSLNGMSSAPSYSLGTTNNSSPGSGASAVPFGWIFGDQNIDVQDRETWAKLDGTFKMNDGPWTDLKVGARFEKHTRTSFGVVGQGPTATGQLTSSYPTTNGNYPSSYSSLGGSLPSNVWLWSDAQLAAYNDPTNVNRNPATRIDYNSMFGVYEKDDAAYVQADFKGDNWAANVGLRYVRTDENVETFTGVNAATPGAIYSDFGSFVGVGTDNSYNNVLPSANFRYDVTQDLVARFAAAETMTRADYSALGGAVTLIPPGIIATGGQFQPPGGGSGGNPNLKPIVSDNFDAGLEWYFDKRSLLSATLFYMHLKNYIAYGSVTRDEITFSQANPTGVLLPYDLSVPINAKGRVEGVEFAYQQAFTDNFGVITNYTFADGKQTSAIPASGDNRLVGASKNTYNLQGYFETQHFSARVNWGYRSSFYSGLDRSSAFTQDSIGELSASLNYTINDHFGISLDGENLNNPELKYYALNTTQPRAFYKSGQQYYLTVHAKL
jgi:iron complex outermembrane recepter protein